MPSLVPPLVATVGINGKVSFLEKGSESDYYKEFKNSTGAYELDLSLVHDSSHAWREMHVKTDIFCSAAIILPDKAARILNVGGWSQSSAYGLRLYAPDGSAGVNGTNDWEEKPDNFQLQVGAAHSTSHSARWFSKSRLYTEWTLVFDRTCSVQRQCSRYGWREQGKWLGQP